MKTIELPDRSSWRAWLEENHDRETEIWLVYFKKGTGVPTIPYGESVEEALCFGWVDSIIRRIDDARYARKFTPRKDDSKWSPSNIKRVEKMIRDGLMTEIGLKKVEAAKQSGAWDNPVQKPDMDFKITPAFAEALDNNPKAKETFDNLAPSHQKRYLGWIHTAKRAETKEKRIKESIRLLSEGKKLGLK